MKDVNVAYVKNCAGILVGTNEDGKTCFAQCFSEICGFAFGGGEEPCVLMYLKNAPTALLRCSTDDDCEALLDAVVSLWTIWKYETLPKAPVLP
jgi:hypothetical protein